MSLPKFVFLAGFFISYACIAAPEEQSTGKPGAEKPLIQQPTVELPVQDQNNTVTQTSTQNKGQHERSDSNKKSKMIDFCQKNPC